MMHLCNAKFVCSSSSVSQIPNHNLREFAFIGRSNVGKSSLINMLCMDKKLAHTSSMPGKTILINHFLVNDCWYLVDLPGYGYATLSKKQRKQIELLINEYIIQAPQLHQLFVLLDARHPLQQIDLDFMIHLAEEGIPFACVLTKCDKLSQTALAAQVQVIQNKMLEYWEELPPFFLTSANQGTGREALADYIYSLLK